MCGRHGAAPGGHLGPVAVLRGRQACMRTARTGLGWSGTGAWLAAWLPLWLWCSWPLCVSRLNPRRVHSFRHRSALIMGARGCTRNRAGPKSGVGMDGPADALVRARVPVNQHHCEWDVGSAVLDCKVYEAAGTGRCAGCRVRSGTQPPWTAVVRSGKTTGGGGMMSVRPVLACTCAGWGHSW